MILKNYIFYLFIFLYINISAQEATSNFRAKRHEIKVTIEDKNTGRSIKDATVFVSGNYFNYSEIKDCYLIKAILNDELRITHSNFEPVYYTIKSEENIHILVEDFIDKKQFSSLNKASKNRTYKTLKPQLSLLDSAEFYKKKNINKSLSFIEKALKGKQSPHQNSATYKTLADIYFYWKQYDLAVNNYKLSLQTKDNQSTRITLAKAQFLLKDFDASRKTYEKLQSQNLTNSQETTILEGLGDIYFYEKKYPKAKTNYNAALQIAKRNQSTSKITDLNSKLADVFAAQGNIAQATVQFSNSLNFASKEDISRTLEEEEKVADFYNSNKRFDKEIKLRKQSLLKAKKNKITKSNALPDSITSQKINYKIGTAYILKEDYNEAIPFLKKSIEDADKKKDIIIEKDATRKLSEVYATVGEYDKALKSYQDYVQLVDESYVQKEQEIQQIKRFSKIISENQNRISSLEKDQKLAESKIHLAYVDQKLSQESNRRQKIVIYALFGGIVLMSLLAYFMFRNIKQQRLANNLLALKSMRSQMNPHFIFNALNSVNSFIAVSDERNANRYLSEFSTLMRSVLENSDEDFIPLIKEIELLELYTKLEHNRFKDKFDYTISVDKNITLEHFYIPPMLLQPYIENAIWHGLRYKKEKGFLTISFDKNSQDSIIITIEDNGIGRKKSLALKTKNQLKQQSKAMSTIKNRVAILNDMYKKRITVNVSDIFENGEGTKVELILKKK